MTQATSGTPKPSVNFLRGGDHYTSWKSAGWGKRKRMCMRVTSEGSQNKVHVHTFTQNIFQRFASFLSKKGEKQTPVDKRTFTNIPYEKISKLTIENLEKCANQRESIISLLKVVDSLDQNGKLLTTPPLQKDPAQKPAVENPTIAEQPKQTTPPIASEKAPEAPTYNNEVPEPAVEATPNVEATPAKETTTTEEATPPVEIPESVVEAETIVETETGGRAPEKPVEESLASPEVLPPPVMDENPKGTAPAPIPEQISELTNQVETLQKEIQEQASIDNNQNLLQFASDFVPLSLPEDSLSGHLTVAGYREQLRQLLQEIDKVEQALAQNTQTAFHASVDRVKKAAFTAMEQLRELDLNIDSPTYSLNALWATANELSPKIDQWKLEFQDVRALAARAELLQKHVKGMGSQIEEFTPYIQDLWSTGIQEALKDNIALPEQIQMLERLIEMVHIKCKEEVSQLFESSQRSLQVQMDIPQVSNNVNKQKAINKVRSDLLAMRNIVWEQKSRFDSLKTDLNKIIEWKKWVHDMAALDQTLISIVNQNEPDSLISRVKCWSSWSSPEAIIADYIKIGVAEFRDLQCRLQMSSKELRDLLDVLSSKQKITLADLSKLSEIALKERSTPETDQLRHTVSCIQILLACVHNNQVAAVKELGDLFAPLIDISKHVSMQNFVAEKLRDLNQAHVKPETDLCELDVAWNVWRKKLQASEGSIIDLKQIAEIQNEFQNLSRKMKSTIPGLTGRNKFSAEELLMKMDSELPKFKVTHLSNKDKLVHLFSGQKEIISPAAYQKILDGYTEALNQLIDNESKKEHVRKSIHQKLDGYIATLNDYQKHVADLENHYKINFVIKIKMSRKEISQSIKEYLCSQEEDAKKWKEKGPLPSVPTGLRSKLPSCCGPSTSLHEVNLQSLSLDDLTRYQSYVQNNIVILDGRLKETNVLSIAEDFTMLQSQEAEAQSRIKELNHESQFQYGRADRLQKALNKHLEAQSKAVKQNPLLKDFRHRLKADISTLQDLLIEFPRNDEKEDLLVQMEEFEGNAEMQGKIRTTFLAQQHKEIENHKSLLNNAARLSILPELKKEADACIGSTNKAFEVLLKGLPVPKNNKKTYSLDSDKGYDIVPFKNLNLKQLKEYKEIIEKTCKNAKAQLELLASTQKKFNQAKQHLETQYAVVNSQIQLLDQNNQLLPAQTLTEELALVSRELNLKIKNILEEEHEQPKVKTSYFCWVIPCCSRVEKPDNSTIAVVGRFTDRIGKYTTKLRALSHKITQQQKTPMSIPDQLEKASTDTLKRSLMARYDTLISDMVSTAEESLQGFQTHLDKTLKEYISEKSSFYKKTSEEISQKIQTLKNYKKEFCTREAGWCRSEVVTPMRRLTPSQLREHYRKVTTDVQFFVNSISTKFPLDAVSEQEEAYKNALEQANKKFEKLKEKGHLWQSYKLQMAIAQIKKETSEGFKGSVQSEEDLKKLSHGLKKSIDSLNDNLHVMPDPKTTPEKSKDQLVKFLELIKPLEKLKPTQKNEIAEEYILMLKEIIIAEMRQKVSGYEEFIRNFDREIQEVQNAFGISPQIINIYQNDISEARKLQKKMYTFETSPDQTIIFGRFGKAAVNKQLDDLTATEIIDVAPDEIVEKLCKKGLASISKNYPFKMINENNKLYQKALSDIEENCSQLSADTQFLYRFELEELVSEAESEVAKCKNAATREEMNNISTTLLTQTQRLQAALKKILGKPDLSVGQQISQMRGVNSKKNAYIDRLKPYLIVEVNAKIKEQLDQLDKFKLIIENISDHLNLPDDLKKEFFDIIKKQKEILEERAKRKQGNATPLELLPATELADHLEDIQKLSFATTEVYTKYIRNLQNLDNTLQIEIAKGKAYAQDLRYALQVASADSLEKDLNKMKVDFTKLNGLDLSKKMLVLYNEVQDLILGIRKLLQGCKKAAPRTLGEQLEQAENAKDGTLIKALKKKIQESIFNLFQKDREIIIKISQDILKFQQTFNDFSDRFGQPLGLNISLNPLFIEQQENTIRHSMEGLEEFTLLASDLGKINAEFENDIFQRFNEKMFTAKITENTKLYHLSFYLNAFIAAVNETHDIIERNSDGLKSDKTSELKELLEMQIELFLRAFANLSKLAEARDMQIIEYGSRILEEANKVVELNLDNLQLDPWTRLKRGEEDAAEDLIKGITLVYPQLKIRRTEKFSENFEIHLKGTSQNLDTMPEWLSDVRKRLLYWAGMDKPVDLDSASSASSKPSDAKENKYNGLDSESGLGLKADPTDEKSGKSTSALKSKIKPSTVLAVVGSASSSKAPDPKLVDKEAVKALEGIILKEMEQFEEDSVLIAVPLERSFKNMLEYRERMQELCSKCYQTIEEAWQNSIGSKADPGKLSALDPLPNLRGIQWF